MRLYSTKLAFFLRSTSVLLSLFLGLSLILKGQNCIEFSTFDDSEKGVIDWSQFPEFELPFELVYGLPNRNQDISAALKHGFTLAADPNSYSGLQNEQKAQIYYGTAYAGQNQPWEELRSPWGNDLSIYENKWQNDFNFLSAQAGSQGILSSDIFCFDIERTFRFDFEILQLKSNPDIPAEYRNLSDAEFLSQYKSDLRNLYARSVSSFLSKGTSNQPRIASYSDTPIVNTFQNIQGKTWQEWQTDKSVLNYICTDENGDVGGPFYDQMDIATPSAYYYYDYPHPFAGEYLSYLLFQIEANKAWTNKPVIPFVWMRYSFNENVVNQYIKPWMAEATAIFPFFSGADGLWLWENPVLFQSESSFVTYSHFLKGLYRLSLVKDFFEGDNQLVIETSARDYNENKEPIWRGVVKGDQILIAAHNPFASDENEEVTIGVKYQNWSTTVTLSGYETKLCVFDMSILSSQKEAEEVAFPNPVKDNLKLQFTAKKTQDTEIRLLSESGKLLMTVDKTLNKGNNLIEINVNELSVTSFFVDLKYDDKRFTKKIIRLE
jgi:hypothetical protein